MFCAMNINGCNTANTPGEYSLGEGGEGVGKDVRAPLASLPVCENRIDLWGLGK